MITSLVIALSAANRVVVRAGRAICFSFYVGFRYHKREGAVERLRLTGCSQNLSGLSDSVSDEPVSQCARLRALPCAPDFKSDRGTNEDNS